jgi:hypothetical protein
VGDNGYVTDGNRHKNREKTQYVKFCLCGAGQQSYNDSPQRAHSSSTDRRIVNKTSQFYPMRFHSVQIAIKLLAREKCCGQNWMSI